jgi:uncharacterized protein
MELENSKAYPQVCHKILADLKKNLAEHLTYHRYEHTIDVANVCNHYIDYYMIADHMAELVRIAAVSHDYGYLFTPNQHEERSIVEVRPLLSDYSDKQFAVITGMIRATKVPQNPQNLYEEIIADSDLDYLGRDDYDKLSSGLYKEFLHFGVVKNELDWLEIQVKFLENHKFHTDWAKMHRSEAKQRVLQKLRDELNSRNLSKQAS